MTPRTVLLVLIGLAAGTATVLRMRHLGRAVARERAVARLTEGVHQRDLNALKTRIHASHAHAQVLADADRILTAAIAAHHPQKEG